MSLCVNGRVFGEAEGRGHLSCLSGAGLHLHRHDGGRKDGDWDVDVPSFMIGEFTPVPLSRRNVRLFNQKGPRHAQSTQSPFERKRCAGKAAVAT